MTTEAGKFCVYFPGLIAGWAPANLPGCVRFLDPGLGVPQGDDHARYHCPDNLPLDSKQARRYLDAMLELGKTFKKPSDVAQLLAMDNSLSLGPDLRSEFAALERFAAREAGVSDSGASAQAPDENAARARAQRTLILARATEERDYESSAISRDLDASVARFESSLGFDEQDEQERSALGAPNAMALAGEGHALSRAALLEGLCALLADEIDNVVLVCANPDVAGDFAEYGLEPVEAGTDDLADLAPGLEQWSGSAGRISAPIWRLIGRKKASDERPWLALEATIVILRPE